MALKPCPECGKPVSTKAAACPNCGYELVKSFARKQKENNRVFGFMFGIAILIAVGIAAAVVINGQP